MVKGIHQPPFDPFPPTEIEAIAITNIGLMFAHILIILFLMILMIYFYKKILSVLPIITIYSFSILIGISFLTHIHTPFSPLLEIFFLVFQTSIFIVSATEINEKR